MEETFFLKPEVTLLRSLPKQIIGYLEFLKKSRRKNKYVSDYSALMLCSVITADCLIVQLITFHEFFIAMSFLQQAVETLITRRNVVSEFVTGLHTFLKDEIYRIYFILHHGLFV